MPFPNFNPVLLQLGPIAIRWYALAYIAGITLGWRYCIGLTRNQKLWRGTQPTLTAAQVDDFILWVTVGIILGGRIGYVLFYMALQPQQHLMEHPLSAFKIWEGGMSFHGGLIGVTLAIVLFAWRNGVNFVRLADITAPCVPIGLFFGRIANFVNGELWGRPTTAPWGIVFCNARLRDHLTGECPAGLMPRHPSQLYEAGLEGIALFLILRFASHGRKLLPRQGAVTGLFLLFYALFRMSLENVREPDQGMPNFPFGLTMGILLSVPLLLLGGFLVWWSTQPRALAPPSPVTAEAPDASMDTLPPEVAADPFLSAEVEGGAPYIGSDEPARPA